MKACHYCQTIIPSQKKKSCGALPCERRRKADKQRTWVRKASRAKAETARKLCKECGKTFVGPSRKYCSTSCARMVENRHNREKAKDYWREKMKAVLQSRQHKACAECGESFFPDHGARLLCSRRCARKRGKYGCGYFAWKRKLDRIIKRDRKCCQLCGKKVVMSRDSHMSPSLDHIVPKAQGGSNDDSNLQLAHWICNVRKGNHIKGQLRIC